MSDEIRYKALVNHIENWERISFDLYSSNSQR